MRTQSIAFLFLLVASCALARMDSVTVSVATGAATTGTGTTTIDGYVEAIVLDVPAGTVTGTYTVAWSPPESTVAAVTIGSGSAITADTWIRPRIDATTTDGTANTSDPPVRYAIPNNGVITVTITNASATNLTWKTLVIYERN